MLFGLLMRQTNGFVESLPELIRLDWAVPDFSTLCLWKKTLPIYIPAKIRWGLLYLYFKVLQDGTHGLYTWNVDTRGGI